MKHLFIISGEKSGDLIAQELIVEIKKRYPHVKISGVGGESFSKNGIRSIFEQKELGVMGFLEIIPKIPRMMKLLSLTKNKIYRFKPDHIITIDSPGFNFRITKSVQHARLNKSEIYKVFRNYTPRKSAKSTITLVHNMQRIWRIITKNLTSFISRNKVLSIAIKYAAFPLRYLGNRYIKFVFRFILAPLHILIKYTPLKFIVLGALGKFFAVAAIFYAIFLYLNTFRFLKWPIIISYKVYNKILHRKDAKKDLSYFYRSLILAQLRYKNTIACNVISIVQTIYNALPKYLKFRFIKSILNKLNLIYKRFKKAEYAKAFGCKFHHVVAPSVWAYKARRAQKVAALYDTMFCILPFEPPYFEKHGLKSVFIGYTPYFRMQEIIPQLEKVRRRKTVISLTLGSRVGEIHRHAPVIRKNVEALNKRFPQKIRFNIIALPDLEKIIIPYFSDLKNVNIVIDDLLRWQTIYNSDFMIAKSGTNVMECALLGVPSIVYYRASALTGLLVRAWVYIKYTTLLNITANRAIFPEFFQRKTRNIHRKAAAWVKNPHIVAKVRNKMQTELEKFTSKEAPSTVIVREIAD